MAGGGRALPELAWDAGVRRFLIRLNAVLGVAALGVWVFYLTLPDVSRLRDTTPATTAFIEQRRTRLRREGRPDRIERIVVPLSRISPAMRRAAILTEDENFYLHSGIDWAATKLALETDLGQGKLRIGGSTITQQLAKNLYLSPSRSLWRKAREIAIAAKMERSLPKNRILELYLNSIEWGERTYGVEAASRKYFGHGAAMLSDRESAALAAMIASPRLFDPARHPRRLARRAARILLLLERVQIPGINSQSPGDRVGTSSRRAP
jgi:monofunctional biosynthetic peptidoglycan transglycosylase